MSEYDVSARRSKHDASAAKLAAGTNGRRTATTSSRTSNDPATSAAAASTWCECGHHVGNDRRRLNLVNGNWSWIQSHGSPGCRTAASTMALFGCCTSSRHYDERSP
ncbi:unnamed protein product [Amoebophrya sp. A25]|nr:unnamed protein product [Amoebophrya sp. A25]|eukprot:GSA25T00020011001.1